MYTGPELTYGTFQTFCGNMNRFASPICEFMGHCATGSSYYCKNTLKFIIYYELLLTFCVRILNNKELKAGNRVKQTNVDEENNRILASVIIDDSAVEDSGEVIVVATNEVGQAYSTAKLIVNGKLTAAKNTALTREVGHAWAQWPRLPHSRQTNQVITRYGCLDFV